MFKISQNAGCLKLKKKKKKGTGFFNSTKYTMFKFPRRTKCLKFCKILDVFKIPKITRCLNFHKMQNVPFIVSLSTAALLHMNPSSARTYQSKCRAQNHDKMNTVCLVLQARL